MKFKKQPNADTVASVSSSSSVKTKKSTNFLSALVRRTKRDKPAKGRDDACSVASQSLDDLEPSDASLLGIRYREEIEISGKYYETESSENSSVTSVRRQEGIKETCGEGTQQETSLAPCLTIQPNVNLSLVNGIRLVQDLTLRLRENDNHLIGLISRFIQDQGVQKQLIDSISQHSKFQWEAERRTAVLINEMWIQQLELEKSHTRTLQDNLNSITKQNRQLQIDNEVLFRRYEKLALKHKDYNKHKCSDCESKLEEMCQRNETLQRKLEETYRAVDTMANETNMLRNRNDKLEEQLNITSSQIQQLKSVINNTKTEYELEVVSLQQNLKKTEKVVKESTREGNLMLEELKKNVKLENDVDVSNLSELIQLCRHGVNETSQEILSLRTQLLIKDKDVELLRETNAKLQENLMKSTSELDAFSKRIEEREETDRVISVQQRQILEADLKATKEKMEKMQLQFEMEKSMLLNTISEFEVLNADLVEKDRMLEQTRSFVCNVTSENVGLRNQINAFLETGAGDVMRELRRCQEQLMYYQTQNNQLMQERNQMKPPEEFQKYLNETEALKKENTMLKQQCDSERRTVLTLQCERTKYLEEKKISRAIFTRIKSELQRAQKLQDAVHDVSRQASKFALMADYNKEVGDRLKSELAEKDKTILMLKTSVEKLNDVQAQEAKEKLSLCKELSKLQVVKEQLSVQLQKNSSLDASRTQMEQTVKHQIKKLEEDKKSDRMVFSELTGELKTTISQKESLIKEINLYKEALKKLRRDKEDHARKIEEITTAKNEMELKLKEATLKNEETERSIKNLEGQLEKRGQKYQDDFTSLKKLVAQLRKEKEDLDSSVKYLQNTVQKLQKDLDQSRNDEKETKRELDTHQSTINSLTEENGKLSQEVANYNKLCEKILDNFESNMKSASEKEELFKRELHESRNAIFECHRQIESMNKQLNVKSEENRKLEARFFELKQQHQSLHSNYKSFEQAYKDLEDSLSSMRNEHQELRKHFHDVVASKEADNLNLRDQLERSSKTCAAIEERNSKLQTQLEVLTAKSDEEKQDLQQQVNILLDGISEGKTRINTLNQEKDSLQRKLDGLQIRYSDLLNKCVSLENNAKKQSLDESNTSVADLQLMIDNLQQELTGCEFQKSELTLRLHEVQKKYETERNLCEQLRNTHKLVLMNLLRLKDEGAIDPVNCNQLIRMVQSGTEVNLDTYPTDELDK